MTRPAPRIDPEELLANAAWVRALARSLVGDASIADDVAQQTMAAAIERPPRAGVPLAAWMARVARNLSFNARRAERRRALHEAAASSRAAPPSPEESVARTEMFRVVVDAVLALEPIYRDVVVLRFFDDLEMTEVAQRLDVPVETARTRLKRALASLRARLDVEYGDRRAWAVVLLGADWRRDAATTSTAAAAAAGGVLMAKKALAVAAALALLLVGGWYVADVAGNRARNQKPTEYASAPVAPRAASPRGRAAVETPKESEPSEAKTAVGAPTKWLLRGRLDGFGPDEAQRAAVAVYVWHEGMDGSKAPEPLRVEAAADGRFDVDFTARMADAVGKKALVVTVDHPAYLPGRAEVSVPLDVTTLECVVTMRRAAVATVRVVDGDGNPLPGAQVGTFALQGRVPDDFSEDSSATDERGYARLRMPAGERRLVVAAAKDHEPACRETTGGADDELKFVLRDGIAVSGRVVQDGRPVVGAEICVSPSSFNGRTIRIGETDVRWNEGGGVDTEDARATTGADGRWRVAGLADGTWRVRLDKLADGSSPMGYDVSIPPPHEPVEFDLSFGRLVVEVRCEGRPVAGVRLAVFIGGSVPSTKTDADGRAELQLAPSRPFAIETEHFGYRETRVEGTSPERGAVESLQIALTAKPPHGAIVVVVKDPDGRPIPRAGLAFFKGDATTPWDAEERFGNQAEGDFAFNDLEAGRYRLVVRPGRHWQPDWTWEGDAGTWLDETLDVEIPATGAKRYEVTARPGGRLRLSARGRDGLRLPAKCVVRDPAGHVVKHYVATRHGNRGAHSMGQDCLGQEAPTDVAEALPPGRYRVTLSVEGGAETSVDAEIVAGKTCELEGKLDAVAGPPPVLVRAEK